MTSPPNWPWSVPGPAGGGQESAGSPAGAPGGPPGDDPARLIAWVEGRVQGVGFRWWVRARALERGLVGCAENLVDGRVKVVAEGPAGRCRDLLAVLAAGRTPGWVRRVTHRWDRPQGSFAGFTER